MSGITTLFFDVGGVLLSNGWDRHARHRAAERFDLEWEEFQDRHERVVDDFEMGTLSLESYLDRTVFHRSRDFSRAEFRRFIFSQSEPHPPALEFARGLRASGRVLLATLNNESRELNALRIERFDLRSIFTVFFSSCFLGDRKPDEAIYRRALEVVQRAPEECVFIDDRAINVEVAALVGLRTIRYEGVEQLRTELGALGIAP